MALTQREAFARLMEHMCEHDGNAGHGYSQPNRKGSGTELVDLGDGVKVYIKGGDRDCSSAICSCLKAVGVDIHGATYTGNMLNLTKNALFKAYKRPTSYSAKRGDIYLNTSHHTAMCTHGYGEKGGDMLCQFSISEKGTVNGVKGDQTGKESNFKAFYDYPWTHTIAWTGNGKTLSGTINNIGASGSASSSSSGTLGNLDYWGPKFTKALQAQLGTTQDGIISYQPKSNSKYLPNVEESTIQYTSSYKQGSQMVRALQKKVGASVDGWIGKETVKKLQSWLASRGYSVGSSGSDGSCGPATCRALGKALNAKAFK